MSVLLQLVAMFAAAALASACLAEAGPSRADEAAPAEKVTFELLLEEMIDRDSLARIPAPWYVCRQASSYDRRQKDPNDESTWFANKDHGEFIRLEENDGREEWVIMEDDSPGCITRIWAPLSPAKESQIVRFYLDGAKTPVIEAEFNQLMRGNLFVEPPFAFVASDEKGPPRHTGVGGDLYLPIPYAKSCKITLSQQPFYYVVNYRSYEAGTEVESFTMQSLAQATGLIERIGRTLAASGNVGAGRRLSRKKEIEPDQSMSIDLPSGGHAVRKLSLKLPAGLAKEALRSAVLEITFDGRQTVKCPVSEFFGGGVRLRPVKDWFRSVGDDGLAECLWVMPYRDSGRVTLSNLHDKPLAAEMSVVVGTWDWDERSMHFHASWRGQSPLGGKLKHDWNYVTIAGRGVYAGDTLTAYNPARVWYGEGDERVYIDGEKFPSHLGTGTEDYYGYAWGMAHKFDSPFISMPLRDSRGRGDWRGHTTTSRLRVLDAIPFRRSLRFDMEAWHVAHGIGYAAATFWYALPGAEYR
ncbi:MAG: glycoside hydrolase family 172 protein [Planctomycetota bacterium]